MRNDEVGEGTETGAVVSCAGGILLNDAFVPLDIDAIDAQAEADVAAGRTYSMAAVTREMDALIAGWKREAQREARYSCG